jgi:hypothetical protein
MSDFIAPLPLPIMRSLPSRYSSFTSRAHCHFLSACIMLPTHAVPLSHAVPLPTSTLLSSQVDARGKKYLVCADEMNKEYKLPTDAKGIEVIPYQTTSSSLRRLSEERTKTRQSQLKSSEKRRSFPTAASAAVESSYGRGSSPHVVTPERRLSGSHVVTPERRLSGSHVGTPERRLSGSTSTSPLGASGGSGVVATLPRSATKQAPPPALPRRPPEITASSKG